MVRSMVNGLWTVDSICFEWSEPDYDVSVCSGDGSVLTPNQELALTCTVLDGITTCDNLCLDCVRLNRIVVKTANCNDCTSDEGIHLELTGTNGITCNTDKLNHPDEIDFATGQTAMFFTETDDKLEDGWCNCYEV